MVKPLLDSMKILSAYGAGAWATQQHSNTATQQHATVMLRALDDPMLKEIICKLVPPESVKLITSPQYKNQISAGLVFLETYVPDAEAIKEKHKWDESLIKFDEIQPGMKAKIEDTFSKGKPLENT